MKLGERIRQLRLEEALSRKASYFRKGKVIFVGGEDRVIKSDGVFAEKIPTKRRRRGELSQYRALQPFSAYWGGECYFFEEGVIFRALSRDVYTSTRMLPQNLVAHFGQG